MDTQAIVDAVREVGACLIIYMGICTAVITYYLICIARILEQRNEEKK
jgi:hypothetical protein